MLNWQGTKPGTFVNNSTIEPVSAENLNAIVNTIDKIATGGVDSGLNADTIRDIDFDALATTSDETLTNFYSFDSLVGASNEILLDDSGLNYHGTAYNITLVKGLISMAGSFNGTSSYASCPYANKAALTVAMWYKGTESVEKPLFILKRANNAVKIGIYINDGCAEIKFLNSDSVLQTIIDTSIINNNKFHHIAVSHTGTSCHLYVDGILRQSLNQTLTSLYYNQAIIGASDEVTPTTFTAGTIDDARIYSSALSQNEVYGIFFNKINAKTTYKPTIADISTLSGKITPLSDLSRVFRLTGDGIPIFPDNVAGRTYWQDDWLTTDGWGGINGTVAVSGGVLTGTATGTPFGIYRDISGSAGSVIRVKIKASVSVLLQFQLRISGVDTLVKTQTVPANSYQYIDIPATSAFTRFIVFYGATVGNTISLDTIYIGSGLYDTPVYDKACCNRFTNNGVLPVPAPRGQGMLFQGAQYLQADNPVSGITGTWFCKLARNAVGSYNERIAANNEYVTNTGMTYYISSTGSVAFSYGTGASMPTFSTTETIADINLHDLVFVFTGSVLYIYIDGLLVKTTTGLSAMAQPKTNLTIGSASHMIDAYFNGKIFDAGYASNLWTANDAIRYHNGDDAVDSQQKAITNVPNAIKICDSKGNIRQPGLPVYADNTTAIAGGLVAGEPYRTSTGSLMVVY